MRCRAVPVLFLSGAGPGPSRVSVWRTRDHPHHHASAARRREGERGRTPLGSEQYSFRGFDFCEGKFYVTL